MKKNAYIIILIAVLAIISLVYLLKNKDGLREIVFPVGGDRDGRGCLIAEGYAYSEDVGACIRAFELTPDIMRAAKIAVDYIGRDYALTVVSFNSYEEVGAYDFIFERGTGKIKQVIYIKNWQVQK